MSQAVRHAFALLALSTITAAVSAQAAPPAWVAKSDQNTQIVLDLLAHQSPEGAADLGISGLDEEITDLEPGFEQRADEATRAVLAQLEKRLAGRDRSTRPAGPPDPHRLPEGRPQGLGAGAHVPDPLLQPDPDRLRLHALPARRPGRSGAAAGGPRPPREVHGHGGRLYPARHPGRGLRALAARRAGPGGAVQGQGRTGPRQQRHAPRRHRRPVQAVRNRGLRGALRPAQDAARRLRRLRAQGDPPPRPHRLPPAAGALRLRHRAGRSRHAARRAGEPGRGRLQGDPERDGVAGAAGRQGEGHPGDGVPRRAARAQEAADHGRRHPSPL